MCYKTPLLCSLFHDNTVIVHKKYSNKLSMKALVEKDILMKKQEKEMRKAPHFFMYIYQETRGNSRELEETRGNSRELEETRGNSRELKGNSKELKGVTGSTL